MPDVGRTLPAIITMNSKLFTFRRALYRAGAGRACLYSLLSTVLLLSCNPKRDNPYDPLSPNYKGEGIVSGRVTNDIGIPIHNALVSTIPPKAATLTDSIGAFILYPDTGNCKLVASFTGYKPETTEIYLKANVVKNVSFYLDGIPVIKKTSAISSHEDKGFPIGEVYWVDVSAKVSDPDGMQDIDSVRLFVRMDSKDLNMYLSQVNNEYFATIPQDSCPQSNIDNLVGKAFVLYVVDKKGDISASSDFYVPRIIYSLPVPVSPATGDSVLPDSIPFIWQRIKVSFPVTYKLTIRDYASLDSVAGEDNITDTTTILPDSLRSQERYLWSVEGKDEFGDVSRSDKVFFIVK